MPTPTVDDLNDAMKKVMQKNQRYMLATFAKDTARARLEWTNLEIAWSEYHQMVDRAPREVVELHNAELVNLSGSVAA